MSKDFSHKVALVLSDYSNQPIEGKALILTNIRTLILAVKSRKVRNILRKLEAYFKEEIAR